MRNRNPILQALNLNNSGFDMAKIQSFVMLMKTAKDPRAAIMQFIQQNPDMQSIIPILQNGGDLRSEFYRLSRENGISNPEKILQIAQSLL